MIIFGSIFIKKSNQTKFLFFLKPKPVQTDRFQFGFLGQQPVQTGLTRFFSGFFRFQAYKIETEPNWSVFLKFNQFFFTV